MEVVLAELEVTPVDGLNVYYDKSNEKYTVISDAMDAPSSVPQDEKRRNPIWRCEKKKHANPTVSLKPQSTILPSPVQTVPSTSTSALSSATISFPTSQSTIPPSLVLSDPQTAILASSGSTVSSRTSQSTSAIPSAVNITPPLGKPAPRDCPKSNGTIFTVASPFDASTATAGAIRYEKICNAEGAATNKTNLASFVVNSFDSCIQSCAGQSSEVPVFAAYHWADGTDIPNDGQRPGTCWCSAGVEAYAVESDNNDIVIKILSTSVAEKLSDTQSLEPALGFALRIHSAPAHRDLEDNSSMVQLLLTRGYNPDGSAYRQNFLNHHSTAYYNMVWVDWLLKVANDYTLAAENRQQSAHRLQTLQILLQFGAQPSMTHHMNADIHYRNWDSPYPWTLWRTLLQYVESLPRLSAEESVYLYQILDALITFGADPDVEIKRSDSQYGNTTLQTATAKFPERLKDALLNRA
ncbi:MAG: hypothetical protein Q9195_001385 [Heterodermia aff. obscurata]